MNAYSDIDTLKSSSYLNVTGTSYDTNLRKLLEQSSRLLDKWCGRFFFVRTETRYYDGAGTKLFLSDDLLAITTISLDEDGDGTYESDMATTDYILYPLNDYPKIRAEISPESDFSSFAAGIKKGVKIVGSFGYGDGYSATPYTDSGVTGTATNSTATTLTLSTSSGIAPGNTVLCESEQIYIQVVSGTSATVRRAMNGTTGTAHTSKALYNYEYPMPITQACLISAMRAWKRKDSAYQDVVGAPEIGQLVISKGLDPDVAEAVKYYRKLRYI